MQDQQLAISEADKKAINKVLGMEEELTSQERSRLVKKKRHGQSRVLIPVAGGQSRGSKKSRRTHRQNIWVDPELLGEQGSKPYARRRTRSAR